MGRLLDGYWKSLKPLEVEEPVDVWVHRPLAYLLARQLLPTSISANAVTVLSMLLGMSAPWAMLAHFPAHMPVAGLCVFLSAVADCADGQLARMRGTSSMLGRMLDGVADLVVSIAVVGGGTIVVLRDHSGNWRDFTVCAMAVAFAGVTGSFHTASYDHYKNLYLRLTHPEYREGEDLDAARRRHAATGPAQNIGVRVAWRIYLFYLKSQVNYLREIRPAHDLPFESTSPVFPAISGNLCQAQCTHDATVAYLVRVWQSHVWSRCCDCHEPPRNLSCVARCAAQHLVLCLHDAVAAGRVA